MSKQTDINFIRIHRLTHLSLYISVDRLRHILITKRRSEYLEEMQEIILGDTIIDANDLENIKIPQVDQSNNISTSIQAQIDKVNAEATEGEKFDRLFALTLTLKHFDHLLQETTDIPRAQQALDALGEAWKLLLPASDDSLEIDTEINTEEKIITEINQSEIYEDSLDKEDDQIIN